MAPERAAGNGSGVGAAGWRAAGLLLATLALAAAAWCNAVQLVAANGRAAPVLPGADGPRLTVARADPAPLLLGDRAARGRAPIADGAMPLLRESPLEATALRNLGLSRWADDPVQGARLLALSGEVRRRDPLTLTVLAAQAEGRGDMPEAIALLGDIATVRPTQSAAIFRTIVDHIGRPGVTPALLTLSDRDWFAELVRVGVKETSDPDAFAEVLLQLEPLGDGSAADVRILLRRLLLAGAGERASALARHQLRMPRAAQAFGLEAAATDPAYAPLTWTPHGENSATWSIEPDGAAAIAGPPGKTLRIASRMTVLSPGAYRLSVDARAPRGGGAVIVLRDCLAGRGGPRRERATLPTGGPVEAIVSIPEQCPVQKWRLLAANTEPEREGRLTLRRLGLEACRRSGATPRSCP